MAGQNKMENKNTNPYQKEDGSINWINVIRAVIGIGLLIFVIYLMIDFFI